MDLYYKAVILIGGPRKGTRFRPLSFDLPKPLFPVAGLPNIQHLIEACCNVPGMCEILIIGFYDTSDNIKDFIAAMQKEYRVTIRYLQEYSPMGTAGSLYYFRSDIQHSDIDAFFVINGDVCGDFPLIEMAKFHKEKGKDVWVTVLSTEATRQQSQQYGCIVENKQTHQIVHYVEKPSTFVSQIINCGVYVCSKDIFDYLSVIFKQKQQEFCHGEEKPAEVGGPKVNKNMSAELCRPKREEGGSKFITRGGIREEKPADDEFGDPKSSILREEKSSSEFYCGEKTPADEFKAPKLADVIESRKCIISLEQDVLMPLSGEGKIYTFHSTKYWSQIKTAGSAIYANRHYLELYNETHPDRLFKNVIAKQRQKEEEMLKKREAKKVLHKKSDKKDKVFTDILYAERPNWSRSKCPAIEAPNEVPFIIGNVYIHPTATVHHSAVLGPNVSISEHVQIGAGVRIKESIILRDAFICDHAVVLYSIIGWNSTIGSWARIEGTPHDPNPNKPFAKIENMPLFNNSGHLNPSITVLGSSIHVPPEVIILNSIILPHKELLQSYKNEILL